MGSSSRLSVARTKAVRCLEEELAALSAELNGLKEQHLELKSEFRILREREAVQRSS